MPAAITDCHFDWSASTTAGGRVSGSVAGKSADATPAASATGSLPLTRVVLRVALTGNPSCSAAFLSLDLAPPAGAAPGTLLFELSLALREQPARASAASSMAAQSAVRGTGVRVTSAPNGPMQWLTWTLIDWSVSPAVPASDTGGLISWISGS